MCTQMPLSQIEPSVQSMMAATQNHTLDTKSPIAEHLPQGNKMSCVIRAAFSGNTKMPCMIKVQGRIRELKNAAERNLQCDKERTHANA
jgi:hypothetical protein